MQCDLQQTDRQTDRQTDIYHCKAENKMSTCASSGARYVTMATKLNSSSNIMGVNSLNLFKSHSVHQGALKSTNSRDTRSMPETDQSQRTVSVTCIRLQVFVKSFSRVCHSFKHDVQLTPKLSHTTHQKERDTTPHYGRTLTTSALKCTSRR